MKREPLATRDTLLNFVMFTLAQYGNPPLTQEALEAAVYQAFLDPAGLSMAEHFGLPVVEWDLSLPEVIGAFGDWLRRQDVVEACGFSRKGTALACEFRECACVAVAKALREAAGEGTRTPPCPIMALFGALLRSRGIVTHLTSYELGATGCAWKLLMEREQPASTKKR
jgi:hypothetical protein